MNTKRDGIYSRGAGRWRVQVSLGRDPETGEYRRIRETVTGSKRDAIRRRDAIRADVQRGVAVVSDAGTVTAYLEEWIGHREKIGKVRPLTARTYRGYVRSHVAPVIGDMRLQDIRPAHVQRVLDRSIEAGLAPRSVLQVHRILSAAFRQAVRWGKITVNPSAGATPPKVSRPELATPSPADIARLIAAAAPEVRPVLTLAAATGARRGEVLAFTWPDVDLEGNPSEGKSPSIRVAKSLQRIDGELQLVDPKSERGQRTIPLAPHAVTVLRRQRKDQAARRLILGEAWHAGNYVFDRGDGRPIAPDSLTGAFERAAARAGIVGVRLHDLRHAYCTQLVERGLPVSMVSQVAGHATPAFTMAVYVHHDDAALGLVAGAIEAAFG